MPADVPIPDFFDQALKPDFAQNGWLVAPSLAASEVEHLRTLWDEVGEQHSGLYATTTEKITSMPLRRQVSGEVVRCLEPFAKGLVRNCRVVQGGFIVKRPGARGLSCHRHPVFMDEAHNVALLVWVAMQDTTAESGCMTTACGTHRDRPLLGHVFGTLEAREVPMKAGEALVMDHRLVHGSRSNTSAHERLAAGILVIPQGVPLWYVRTAGPLVEVFEVPDDFYLRWLPGTPPPLESSPAFRLPLPTAMRQGRGSVPAN